MAIVYKDIVTRDSGENFELSDSITEILNGNPIRIVKNLYPVSSEVAPTANGGSGTVTNGVALPVNPWGFKVGFTNTAFSQHNITIPADNNYYVCSFFAYVAPAVTGAVVGTGNMGINGIDIANFSYNVDTPLSSTGAVFVNPAQSSAAGSALSRGYMVEKYPGGWYRFSRIHLNNGAGTVFVFRIDASATVVCTGMMFEQLPNDGSNVNVSPYTPTLVSEAPPFLLAGRSGVSLTADQVLPFQNICIYSDSIFGSGTFRPSQFANNFGAFAKCNTVGGTKMFQDGFGTAPQTAILTRAELDRKLGLLDNALVVLCGGRNDDLSTLEKRQAIIAATKQFVGRLNSGNFLIFGIIRKYPTTNAGTTATASISGRTITVTAGASLQAGRLITGTNVLPGTFMETTVPAGGGTGTVTISQTVASTTITQSTGVEEINFLPNPSIYPAYSWVNAMNALYAEAFPGRFYDPNVDLVNAYNPLLPGDVVAKAYDYRPPSITGGTASTDNLHPIEAENYIIVEGLTKYLKNINLYEYVKVVS